MQTIKQLIAELCDGDKNVASREAITIETLERMYKLDQEGK